MPVIDAIPTIDQSLAPCRLALASFVPTRSCLNALSLVALTGLFTLLNCAKPLHVDDAAYVLQAAHIAEYPLAPYDFSIYWDYHYQSANRVLAPPVLLYWFAGAQVVFGDDPFWWKFSLLPFHFALTMSVFALMWRWAARYAMPLTWMAVLSPALLPSSNLMLDVPSLALSLAAVSVLVYSRGHQSEFLALLAGVLAGLAMQTKYSAFVTPAVVVAYGLTHGRLGLALVSCATAVAVFVAWELLVAIGQKESHFLLAFHLRGGEFWPRFRHLILPTATLTAALTPGALLLALLNCGRPGLFLVCGIVAFAGGFLAIGFLPAAGNALYPVLTCIWWCAVAIAAYRLSRSKTRSQRGYYVRNLRAPRFQSMAASQKGTFLFLVLWVSLEFAFSLLLSPFPAARRVLGVTVAVTVLMGYLVSQYRPSPRLVWTAATAGMALGLAVALIDHHEAVATEELGKAAARIATDSNTNTIGAKSRTWFSGTWAFQHYAMRQGMMPLDPGISELRTGDVLILANQQVNRIDFRPDLAPLERVETVTIQDKLPWHTLVCYYCGATPVKHHKGPRLSLTVYRVLADFVPMAQGNLPGM